MEEMSTVHFAGVEVARGENKKLEGMSEVGISWGGLSAIWFKDLQHAKSKGENAVECNCCMSLLTEKWVAAQLVFDVNDMFSEVNWVQCGPLASIWSAGVLVSAGSGETQEWERALWAVELVFLNILHIAHESCKLQKVNNLV